MSERCKSYHFLRNGLSSYTDQCLHQDIVKISIIVSDPTTGHLRFESLDPKLVFSNS